ncbi:hypothetical protein ACE38V_01890 [Cytobacillus sp. Hz8]|uniref:hypothetical protein n=1 Tax=Cytobacillus sp. Hz8 TaxID=3347168 RepID=UPI0035D6C763
MPVFVYQTFVIKQEKFKEAIENLREIKKFRNENYNHTIEILTPVSGKDHTYALLSTYEGLAEMELQNKKMFEDEEYIKLIGDFFLENIAENSMFTQIFRTISEVKTKKKSDDSKNK